MSRGRTSRALGRVASTDAPAASADGSSGSAEAHDLLALQALLDISQAVLGAEYFDEVLEVIAEKSLAILGAASVSISRWEPDLEALRVLINVGDLGAGEQRWPTDEVYSVAEDPHVRRLIERAQPYTNCLDDPAIDPACAAVLRQLDRYSEVAVPVMYDGGLWGEIWVSGLRPRRFDADDVQLLQAVAAHVAMAIGRSELLSTVWRYAHQDPLTGLANRRALDQFFGEMHWDTASPVLLLCDLDGFKQVNDTIGHAAGDAELRRVADALDATATSFGSPLVVRLGGDEFCVVLVEATLADAERFAQETSRRLNAWAGGALSLSWGAADAGTELRTGQQLIAAADSALLEAKDLGRGWFRTRVAGNAPTPDRRRSIAHEGRRNAHELVRRVAALLDDRSLDTVEALEVLAAEAHRTINAAAWTISMLTDDGTSVQTICGIDCKRDPVSGLRVLRRIEQRDVYPLTTFPATRQVMREGGTFFAAVDLPESDPAELLILERYGYDAVLGVAVTDGQQSYLLEIFSDTGHADLVDITPHLRVLAHYCVARPTRH